jgi:hypothetical protein
VRAGRPKLCFIIGLVPYGIGALIGAACPGLGVLIPGNSIVEGRRYRAADPTRLHPHHNAVRRRDVTGPRFRCGQRDGWHRRIIWRPAFAFQVVVVGRIIVLTGAVVDPLPVDRTKHSDGIGAVPSAAGLLLVVIGGARRRRRCRTTGHLARRWSRGRSFLHIRRRARDGNEHLPSSAVFRNRIANLGLVIQDVQRPG